MALLRATPRITRKFILYLMMVSVLPLLAVSYASYQSARDTVLAQARQTVAALVDGQVRLLDRTLDQVEGLIANLSGIEDIGRGFARDEPQDDYGRLATQARIGYILNGYLNLDGLVSIDLFAADGQHFHVGDTLDGSRLDQAVRDRLYAQAQASGRTVYWTGVSANVNEASRHPQVLAAARVLMHTDRATLNTKPIGLIVVNLDPRSLGRQFGAARLRTGAFLTLIDQQGRLLYDPDPQRVGQDADPGFLAAAARAVNRSGAVRLQWRASPYLLNCEAVARADWTLCHAIPERTLFAEIRVIRQTAFVALVLGFLVVAGATWVYSQDLVRPILEVITSFKRLQSNSLDPSTRLPVRTRDEIGELVSGFNAFMDTLSAHAAADRALRASEERYALAVRATNDILWDWDLQTQALYLSPRYQDLLGLTDTRLERTPDDWLERIHPDDTDAVRLEIGRHLDGSTDFFCHEYRLRHHNGGYLWFLSRGLAERDGDGLPIRMAGSHTDISDRKRAEEQLRHDALYDHLTGLHNRTWLQARLERMLRGGGGARRLSLAVLFIDLDRFKTINDTLGHEAGDALLIAVAARLRAELRAEDGLVRLGGDEFVVLVTEGRRAADLAARLISALGRPFLLGNQEVQTGASIGIAHAGPDYRSADEVLRDADIAMYQAKDQGKGRFQVFDHGMRERIVSRLEMEKALGHALSTDQLTLVYQPIVSMEGYRLEGFEALARWVHPGLGPIPPDQFVAMAEESNLIIPLGRWAFSKVCRRLRTWQSLIAPGAPLRIAVNFSPRQLFDEDLIDAIPRILDDHGVSGERLVIEVTETAILDETQAAARVLERLRALGIRVHLDDFGTGYSSLSHLAGLPIDAIKIDRSFVNEIETSERKRVMLHGIILLARQLGITTIAEGVETAGQAGILLAEGCDYCQGYLVSYPLTAADAAGLLSARGEAGGTRGGLGLVPAGGG
ncbi:EAL domain-containing protein [uncultured Thiodictyon sp.]|jgi:diguanylate cyclase (GGDEF)-like protein/PAS domain S-box-containing protein|uniref:bifunctional diguanylate cyclase/phosphodiesterase n=1 Tax=uncultured Thiodictyon sp. TaxID=1846217 RepID=UPI0025ED0E52|nr:EAL domain-containing protein [uncultured Thiodictyon sp.]